MIYRVLAFGEEQMTVMNRSLKEQLRPDRRWRIPK